MIIYKTNRVKWSNKYILKCFKQICTLLITPSLSNVSHFIGATSMNRNFPEGLTCLYCDRPTQCLTNSHEYEYLSLIHSVIIVLPPILLSSSKSTLRIWCQSIVFLCVVYNQVCKQCTLLCIVLYRNTVLVKIIKWANLCGRKHKELHWRTSLTFRFIFSPFFWHQY